MKTTKELMGNIIIMQILDMGFITGSHAYGTAKEGSDLDIVIQVQDKEKVRKLLIGSPSMRDSDYFAGFKAIVYDYCVNIIPVHPHEFLPWFLTTEAMKVTLVKSGITNKILYCSIFQGMVALFKATLPQLQNLEAYEKLNYRIIKEGYDV